MYIRRPLTRIIWQYQSTSCWLYRSIYLLHALHFNLTLFAAIQTKNAFRHRAIFLVFSFLFLLLSIGNFFTNIGSILLFAIPGTIISALVVGGGIFLLGQAEVVYTLDFIESFAFGSLISAVDPVATLAIFQALDVDPVLNMLVR